MCLACGAGLAEWEHSISLGEAVRIIQDDPGALEGLLNRSCRRCGHVMEWDVAIVPGSRLGTLAPSRQRRLAGTIRRLLRESATEDEMAREIQVRYGVTGFYVRQ